MNARLVDEMRTSNRRDIVSNGIVLVISSFATLLVMTFETFVQQAHESFQALRTVQGFDQSQQPEGFPRVDQGLRRGSRVLPRRRHFRK